MSEFEIVKVTTSEKLFFAQVTRICSVLHKIFHTEINCTQLGTIEIGVKQCNIFKDINIYLFKKVKTTYFHPLNTWAPHFIFP